MSQDDRPQGSRSRFGYIAIRVIIPAVFIALLWHIFTHMARFGTVVSESMSPTLEVGDYYVLRVDAYEDGRTAQRGDIVVFERPDQGDFVKRVIAVAGDEIGIAEGRVWLNGAWLDEPYLKEQPVTELPMATVVPEGHLFMLGDNRNHSEDSRDFGPIPVDSLMGKVTKILWPPGRLREFGPIEYQ